MGPTELLAELNRRGVEIAVDGDRLRFRPQSAVTADLHAAIVQHKASLITLVVEGESEVCWRAAIMREQVRPGASIPFLVVRRDFSDIPGVCMSCDGPLDLGRRIRCTYCVRAVQQVLNERLEGLQPSPSRSQVVGG